MFRPACNLSNDKILFPISMPLPSSSSFQDNETEIKNLTSWIVLVEGQGQDSMTIDLNLSKVEGADWFQ